MRIPSLTIDVLLAVVALADRKTYELAGTELALSASAVHKRVRAAESVLGRRLFVGTDVGTLLTEEGRVFYADAVRAVEQILLVEEKTKAFISLNAGRLLVGHSTYLPPRLLALIMRLDLDKPAGAQIQHFPGITASLAQRVVDGTLHAAFGELSITHPALLTRQLLEEPLVVCMSKSHPLASQASIRPKDLTGLPMIAVSRESLPMQHMEINQYFEDFGVRLNIVADAFGPPEALSMVEHNMGISLLSVSDARSASVVVKQLWIRNLTRKSGIFVREDNRHAVLDEFISVVLRKAAPARKTAEWSSV